MKTKLLIISLMTAALMFVFTGASWAGSGKNRHGNYRPEKRITSKHHSGRSQHQPVYYKHNIKRHPKTFYKNHRYRYHKFYHRNKWIHKNRPHYRHGRYYSENSYDEDTSYNEFSVAATISEPGVEFSIGTKRTW